MFWVPELAVMSYITKCTPKSQKNEFLAIEKVSGILLEALKKSKQVATETALVQGIQICLDFGSKCSSSKVMSEKSEIFHVQGGPGKVRP